MTQKEKLVRDLIPDMIRRNNEPCEIDVHYRKAQPEEMRGLLIAKLREEIAEFEENPGLEELADLYEVLRELALDSKLLMADVSRAAQAKAAYRGAFHNRFVLFLKEK